MTDQIYVYLAKRDKKEIRPIASFPSNIKCYPTKIDLENIDSMGMSDNIEQLIKFQLNKNRLTHEIYIESASSSEELRKSLIAREYKNIPLQQISFVLNNVEINEKALVTKKTTMIKKHSDQARVT